MEGTILLGPGYSASVPPGGQVQDFAPFGMNRAYWPPGAVPRPNSQAVVLIEVIALPQVQPLLFCMMGMDDAFMGMMNAQSMGIGQVLGVGPMRTAPIGGAMGYIREFDGLGMLTGLPFRFTMILLTSPVSALKLTIGIRLDCWAAFTGPCLAFVASISLGSTTPATETTLRAVVDPSRRDQVEYQLVHPDQSTTPITAMPLFVGHMEVVQIDQSIRTGTINGVGIALGPNSIAAVTKPAGGTA